MKPRVVCAAILMDDGLIVPGVRHYSPDMRAVMARIYGDNFWTHEKEQGFVDSSGKFLSREEAYKRADELGQVWLFEPGGKGRISVPPNQGGDHLLFSENLY